MEAKERIYNGMLMNGFLALLVNLVVLPVLAFLTMYYMMDVTWFSIPVMIILSLVFFIMFAGYFSQEPNEARVMVFFGKYEGTFKETGFYWVNPFMEKKKLSMRARNLDVEPIKVNDKLVGYVRRFADKNKTWDTKCVDSSLMPAVIRTLKGEAVTDVDYKFMGTNNLPSYYLPFSVEVCD